MEKERDYFQDITEIRSMMERSSKFLSLSGWVGILIGTYSLIGAFIAHRFLLFNPTALMETANEGGIASLWELLILGCIIILLTIITSLFFSQRRAKALGEKPWSPTARHLITSLAIPLVTGGFLLLILMSHGLTGMLAPISLMFYGMALVHAAKFTYSELKILGLIQISLGLLGSWFIELGLLLWAIGFGAVHIIYGIYMHYKYEK